MLTCNKLSAIDGIDFKFIFNVRTQTYVWHEILIHFCVQVGTCIISKYYNLCILQYIQDNIVIY
jgi:hypothetical protein